MLRDRTGRHDPSKKLSGLVSRQLRDVLTRSLKLLHHPGRQLLRRGPGHGGRDRPRLAVATTGRSDAQERVDEASQRHALIEHVGQHPGHLGREPGLIGMSVVVLLLGLHRLVGAFGLGTHQDTQTLQDVLGVPTLEILRQVGGLGVIHDADRSRLEEWTAVLDRA